MKTNCDKCSGNINEVGQLWRAYFGHNDFEMICKFCRHELRIKSKTDKTALTLEDRKTFTEKQLESVMI